MSNCTIPAPSNSTSLPESGSLEDIMAFVQVFVPFAAFMKLPDWLKLAILGTVLETARRLLQSWWTELKDSIFLSVHFDSGDDSYEWITSWLARQPGFQKSRDIEVSTANNGTLVPGEDADPMDDDVKPLKYIPSPNVSYSLWFKNRWVHVSRSKSEIGDSWNKTTEDRLHMSILSRDHRIVNQLLLEAKKVWNEERENGVCVYTADSYDDWRCIATRPKRPIRSIILDPTVKDLLLEDARDFLSSRKWYAERGIPFRRGYLLYGKPGSGKTSLIHSIAGELDLDVYIISLSRTGLDDNGLTTLIGNLPSRCIALMEDIDAAFKSGITRDSEPDSEPSESTAAEGKPDERSSSPPGVSGPPGGAPVSKVTLSGLLNALDGIGAQEGRILFATTNRYSALDSALTRPGRMDLHIEFQHATGAQAEALFKYFYMPADEEDSADENKIKEEESEKVDEGTVKVEDADANRPLIELDDDDESSSSVELPPTPPLSLSCGSPARQSVDLPATPTTPMSPSFMGISHKARAPKFSRQQYSTLARRFGKAIPDGEFSMASLQGYLMAYKVRPMEAVTDVRTWVAQQRKERAKKDKQVGR